MYEGVPDFEPLDRAYGLVSEARRNTFNLLRAAQKGRASGSARRLAGNPTGTVAGVIADHGPHAAPFRMANYLLTKLLNNETPPGALDLIFGPAEPGLVKQALKPPPVKRPGRLLRSMLRAATPALNVGLFSLLDTPQDAIERAKRLVPGEE